jgi:3-hydroxyacyl-CoA dehydrogenase
MSGEGQSEGRNTAHYTRQGAIAVITMDHPPVNALGRPLRAAIRQGLEKARDDAEVKAVILIGTQSAFSAGADIKEKHVNLQQNREDTKIPDTLEKPLIAAIGGFALGGGLEVALCCHYRIATRDARLGLTEVRLGRIPGSGGTQRLPRLVGVEAACRMLLTGETVRAPEALGMGLVDRVADGELLPAALNYAEELIREGKGPRRIRDLQATVKHPESFFAQRRAELQQTVPGYEAPLRILECIEAAATLPFEAAKAIEERHGDEARISIEARGLQQYFFAERSAAKLEGQDSDSPLSATEIRQLAVIGSGEIAMHLADRAARSGLEVHWINPGPTAASAPKRHARITLAKDAGEAADCTVVIEADFGGLPRAQRLQRLEAFAVRGAVVASCTDAPDIHGLASVFPHPSQLAGLYLPACTDAGLMEIIRGPQTGSRTVATLIALAKRMGASPVVTRPASGTACHRLLKAVLAATRPLIMNGTTPAAIDLALERWGFKPGLMRLARETLPADAARWPALQEPIAGHQNLSRPDDEIVAVVLDALADEAFAMKSEGLIARTSDVDVICVAGHGFPKYRGGPVFLHDTQCQPQ